MTLWKSILQIKEIYTSKGKIKNDLLKKYFTNMRNLKERIQNCQKYY